MDQNTKEGVATVDEDLKRYRQILARMMKIRTELLEEIGPDIDKLAEWTVLDHHNSVPWQWQAVGEYLWLLQQGRIPKGSKLALGIIEGRQMDGEVVNRLPVKIAILPNNEMRILEASGSTDILRAEIADTGTLPFRGKILELNIEAHEVEVPDDLVPEGFRKCKECGKLFEKEGRRVFCSNKCRSRFHVRETRRRQKEKES